MERCGDAGGERERAAAGGATALRRGGRMILEMVQRRDGKRRGRKGRDSLAGGRAVWSPHSTA